MKYSLFIVSLAITLKNASSLFCYWNTGCPYKYFGTRTPYSAVRGDIRDTLVNTKGCEPIGIWGFFRNGKTYPTEQYAQRMKAALFLRNYIESSSSIGNSSLCAQDVENLKNLPINNDMFKLYDYLNEEGHQDMVDIGRRLQHTFPELLKNLKDEDVTFISTGEIGVDNSMKAFIKGLGNLNFVTPTEDEVKMISPHTCDEYTKEFPLYSQTNIEDKYVMNPEYLAAKDRIQRRTGINITLTIAQVQDLYDLCRYTWSSVENRPSPWCAVFTTDDLKILEYQKDLREYYRHSYGHPMSKKFGYPLAGNLLKSFRDVIEGRGKKIVAYFGRSKILNMFYTSLGLYKDHELLTSVNRDPGRRRRTSNLVPFSANFMAVLNRCKTNNSADFNVVFYQNEEPLGSICRERVCSWQEFDDKLSPFVNSTLDFCKVDPHT